MAVADDPGRATLSAAFLRRSLLAALVLGFLVLVGVAATTAVLVKRDQDYTGWVNHTYVVERHLSAFNVDFERAEAARRGYLLTRNPVYLATYRGAVADLPRIVQQVQALTADNPHQQKNVAALAPLLTEKLASLQASLSGAAAADGRSVIEQDQGLVDRIRRLLRDMADEENRLLEIRTGRQGGNADMLLAVVLASGLLLALIAGASLLVMRRYAADLSRSQDDLKRLNDGLEQTVRARTADLTRANEEIQRFAYIVSHDLRSPLVNVMGFTSELEVSLKDLRAFVAQAQAHAPDRVAASAHRAVDTDIPEAIGFIRSSTGKMDRLIKAILTLSRQGRRTLNLEPLSMTTLVEGVAETLKITTQERGAEILVEAPLPDLVGDRLALEQVFANVVENALKYLKPGRPGRIVVRGRADGRRVIYEIQDNGRGIDPKDHERVFELFRRSGAQDQPGEGIGLAHVRALMYRLGGAISVESELDQGATFRLSLPRDPSRDEGPPA